jgi:hypothetical protein
MVTLPKGKFTVKVWANANPTNAVAKMQLIISSFVSPPKKFL